MELTEAEVKQAQQAKREYQRAYAKAHRERLNEYQRKWNKANPDKVRANRQRYWLKKAQAEGLPLDNQ